jgi:biotin carboxyl carrier protein
MEHEFLAGGELRRVSIETKDGKLTAAIKDRRIEFEAIHVAPHTVFLLVGERSYRVRWARQGNRIFLAIGAARFCLQEPDREGEQSRIQQGASSRRETTVKAPMPGHVIKVLAGVGDRVNPGDGLVVVEAMKMEHEMRATFAAIIEKVHVAAGHQVDAFQPLVELKPLDESG